MFKTASCLLVLAATALGAPSEDEVKSLPGWAGQLPARMWSGYVDVGENKDRHIHYWFVSSQGNPDKDPLVLWTNGGPGASSLIGMFTELGMFSLNVDSLHPENSSAVPTLFKNPHAWNQYANILYFEHPAGVGFSYCSNKDTCWFDDKKAGSDLYDALMGFYDKFPEFENREFYITGESYAGIYIPELVLQIEKHQPKGVNLVAMAIGDGCIGNAVGSCGPPSTKIHVRYLAGMGYISQVLYGNLMEVCEDFQKPNVECKKLLDQMDKEAGKYYVYNIYDTCGSLQSDPMRGYGSFKEQFAEDPTTGAIVHRSLHTHIYGNPSTDSNGRRLWKSHVAAAGPDQFNLKHMSNSSGVGCYKCGSNTAMGKFLDNTDVQKAIHVKTDVPSFPFNYTRSVATLLPAYRDFTKKYRVLIYSGQADACVPFVDSEEWTRGLGLEVKEGWHPWLAELNGQKQMAGHATNYENGFTFITVNGAGHMVPQFMPEKAESMFVKFLNGEDF